MDPLLDPFSPTTGANPAAPGNSNVGSQWSQALGDPGVRTALLQFGISMLQPPSFGDTTGSQIGRAIGDAGESVGRRDESERKQQETDSKAALRDAQSTAAEARATAAGARAGAAGAGLELKKGQLDLAQQRLSLSQVLGQQRRRIDAANAYNKYLQQAQSNELISGQKPLSQDEFYSKFGFGDIIGGGAPGGTRDNSGLLGQAKAAIAAGANPDAVRERYRSQTGEEPPF